MGFDAWIRGLQQVMVRWLPSLPDKIINAKLKKPIVDSFILTNGDMPNQPLNLLIAIPMRVSCSIKIPVLDVTQPRDSDHPCRQKGPYDQFVIVNDMEQVTMASNGVIG